MSPYLRNRGFMIDSAQVKSDDIEAGGSFLTRALLQTLPTVYELSYAPLWTLEGELAVPVAGNLAGFTEKVEEIMYQAKGDVKEYVDHTSDIPTLQSAYESTSFNVHTFAIASEYSLQQLAAYEVQPQKLSKDLAAIDKNLRQSVHRLLVFGSQKRGSTGIMNDPNIPLIAGTGYDPAGATATTWQEHIDFFSDIICQIEDNNELTTRIGSVKIPNKLYAQLTRTRQAGDSSMSVMQALRADYPNVRFERLNECRANLLEQYGAKAVGSNEDRIVFCPVMDNSQMDRLADAPNVMPSQWKDLTYRTVFYVRSSQTMIHQPKSFAYVDVPTFG